MVGTTRQASDKAGHLSVWLEFGKLTCILCYHKRDNKHNTYSNAHNSAVGYKF